MRILLVEPYYTGSHAAWADGYRVHSAHDVVILSLGGRHWKWRMHGGSVTLARRFLASDLAPDLVIASDMLDLATFQALTRARTASVPMAVYFHENQLTYPWSPGDDDVARGRDRHYGFINYTSAMAADAVFFNSAYHLQSFYRELERFLDRFPDHNELGTVASLRARSSVLRLGLDLSRFDAFAGGGDLGGSADDGPLVLWNHRWEYDKNPGVFFAALRALADGGLPFRVAVLGESFARRPEAFSVAREALGERVVHFGYVQDFAAYARWLFSADVLPVTSRQDFFGASVVEAVYCGCRPLLPRRLAYPELMPETLHGTVFYDGEDEFVVRLDSMLRAPAPVAGESLRTAMRRFDWATMAPICDRVFENVGHGVQAGAKRVRDERV